MIGFMVQCHIIHLYINRFISNDMLGCVTFLRELNTIRDSFLDLSNGLVLSTDEVEDIIFYICRSLLFVVN
jgi:hypothetical protein